MEKKDIINMSICRRCGRKLKTEESKKLGFGKVCYKKWLSESTHKPLF